MHENCFVSLKGGDLSLNSMTGKRVSELFILEGYQMGLEIQ